MKSSKLKSAGAIVAGVLFIIIVSTLVDILLHAVGLYPPMNQPLTDGQALLASSYRLLISVAGAYLTARLAPTRPMRHAVILGVVGIALGMIGLIATWKLALGPRWYPISLVVLALPQCWLGGWLFERRRVAQPLAG